jgi:hypothetical protein
MAAPTKPTYPSLTEITDPKVREVLRIILEKHAKLQDNINATAANTNPLTGNLNSNNKLITQVADPINPQDAVNKRSVMQLIQSTLSALGVVKPLPTLVGGGAASTGSSVINTPPGPPGKVPPPPAGARTQVCSVAITFQGLTVNTAQYGNIPWFEVALTSLSPADRQTAYAAKKAAGDTHALMALTWNYNEAPSYTYPVPGTDMSKNLQGFKALVQEAITAGFIVMVFLGGDGESKPKNPDGTYPYNDPQGWTYGYQWLIDNLPTIISTFQKGTDNIDLTPYVIFVPGFDGVMPGWDPAHLDNYLIYIRSLLGSNGYVGLELAAGYSHWGAGAANWTSASGQAVDVVLNEFPGPPTGDQVWQIAPRMIGPAYNRQFAATQGQLPTDDPNPPWYLRAGTPRGPFFPVAFEYDEFRWVRGQISASAIAGERANLKSYGYSYFG